MFRAALESIDAGTSLLALGQVSQAFLLFMQASEVSLKGVLDEISEIGTKTWAAQNPVLVRNLANSSQHFDESRLRQSVTEKTFIGAFREVQAYIAFTDQVVSRHVAVNNTRNRIAHQGGDREQANLYLAQIIECLLPLLDEFFDRLIGQPICRFIGHRLARELIVAARFLRRHSSEMDAWKVALRPMAAAYFSNRVIEHGAPIDFDPHGYGWNDRSDLNFEWEQKVAGSLKGNVLEEEYTICRICGERCFVATEGELKWQVHTPYFEVSSMACPHCHLSITEEHSDLARIHYGPIDEQLLGHESWVHLVRDFGLDPYNLQES